jgi:hypothetical protein
MTEENKRLTEERILVKLVNGFFKDHDELNCCSNKKLKEGTWEQIKINAKREFDKQ